MSGQTNHGEFDESSIEATEQMLNNQSRSRPSEARNEKHDADADGSIETEDFDVEAELERLHEQTETGDS